MSLNFCVSCGVAIPSGQRVCSMCYGDPFYGSDGYYLGWLNDMYEEAMLEDEIKRQEYFASLDEELEE